MFLTSKTFWKDAAERAAKTFGQAAVLAIGEQAVNDGINVINVNWLEVGGFGLGGAALSVLTSIASARAGEKDTASLVVRHGVVRH